MNLMARSMGDHAAERARRFEDCLTQSREAAKGAVPVEIERLATIAVDRAPSGDSHVTVTDRRLQARLSQASIPE